MKIGNGKAGFRLWFSQEELEAITQNGKTKNFSLQLNAQSPNRFIVLSPNDLPHGERVMLSKSGSAAPDFGDQFFLTPSARFKPFLSQLPYFGSEVGIMKRDMESSEPTWTIMRPKMDVKQQSKPERTKPKKAFGHEKPEKVEPEFLPPPNLPKVPANEHKLIDLASGQLNMEAAIDIINRMKASKGDSMILEITPQGRLKVLLEYGG